jgi:hypothetical protein
VSKCDSAHFSENSVEFPSPFYGNQPELESGAVQLHRLQPVGF